MKLKHVVSPLVAMLPSLALPYTPYLSCLPPLETAFLSFRPPTGNRVLKFEAPYSCENGLHCLNHPPFPSFVCSGPENARSLVIGDPNLTCSWFINVGVVFTYLSVYERNEEKRNCTKRKFSAQISFPEMMKGKKEAPSPSPPFWPRLLNQSRLTFPPLCLGERESRLWSTQRLKRQIVGQINPFRSSGKIYGIGKPKRIYQNRSILSKYLVDTRLFLSSVGFESSLQRIKQVQ